MQKARRHTLLPGCPRCHSAPTACRHMVSGSYPSPSRGSFHLSVALLGSLSVVRQYLALRDGPRRFSRDSTWPDLLRYLPVGHAAFAYGTVTLCGLPFQCSSASRWLSHVEGPPTPQGESPRFGLFPFRSPLLGKSRFLSFPADTEMFQFSAFATYAYEFSNRLVQGSRDQSSFDSSSGLFAVFHALLRLLTPRHPPCALSSLAT